MHFCGKILRENAKFCRKFLREILREISKYASHPQEVLREMLWKILRENIHS